MIPVTEKDPNHFIHKLLVKKLVEYGLPEDYGGDGTLKELLDIDSLDVVELAMNLERDLDIVIEDHQIDVFRGLSIDSITSMLVENYSTQHNVNNGKR